MVDRQHFSKADRNPKASKENVKQALQELNGRMWLLTVIWTRTRWCLLPDW